MTALAFRAVACVRRGQPVFAALDFALGPGEAAVVTGPNGVGKSSLIRIAAGLLAPAAGDVTRDGGIALLAEAAALDGERTLADALAFWARIDGQARGVVHRALEALDLAPLHDVPVRMLSTGQRRRAAFARVVSSGAPIWLLDEPANGLDAAAVRRLEGLIDRHLAGGGIAIVATHVPVAVAGARTIDLGAYARMGVEA